MVQLFVFSGEPRLVGVDQNDFTNFVHKIDKSFTISQVVDKGLMKMEHVSCNFKAQGPNSLEARCGREQKNNWQGSRIRSEVQGCVREALFSGLNVVVRVHDNYRNYPSGDVVEVSGLCEKVVVILSSVIIRTEDRLESSSENNLVTAGKEGNGLGSFIVDLHQGYEKVSVRMAKDEADAEDIGELIYLYYFADLPGKVPVGDCNETSERQRRKYCP